MARVKDRYPTRGNDPKLRATTYVERREGATDGAKERRRDRALGRTPALARTRPPDVANTLAFATASVAWNPVSLADGADDGVAVTVSGVANDGTWVCHASFTSLATLGNDQWLITAWPSNTNEVIVRILNVSGNTHDLGSGTVAVLCWELP